MNKIVLDKPLLIGLYGFPGSGKSFVARNIGASLPVANVSAERIRGELFESPRYDNDEEAVLTQLMNYMTEEFLSSGLSVVYDANAPRLSQRRALRELARKHKAEFMLIWLQIDQDSAFSRTQSRDRRTADDRHATPHSENSFNSHLSGMQNPQGEDYLVISGKHTFSTQKNAILNRLYHMGLLDADGIKHGVAKPGLVNLVPNPQAGRVDLSRRNIVIR